MQAATIKLFLVHGSPRGLRTAELSNWSGKAIAAPRTEISELLKREELRSMRSSLVARLNIIKSPMAVSNMAGLSIFYH